MPRESSRPALVITLLRWHITGDHSVLHCIRANELVAAEGLTYINGFNDAHIIRFTGAGTCALEIFGQCPEPDAIVVPVGGGGLIAGNSLVSKTLRPQTEIIGVESSRCASMAAALEAGRPVQVVSRPPWPMVWRCPK